MRIAQVAPLQYTVPPRLAGGTERIISYLSDALVRMGHTVTLFAADGSMTSAHLALQGLPAQEAGGDAGTRAVNEAAMLREVADRAAEFDIVHCHTEYYHAAVLAPIGRRLVTTLHWRTDEADRQQLFKRFPDLQCVCISKNQQESVPIGNRTSVVHHGLPVDAMSIGAGCGNYLAFLGRLTDQKRPDIAVDVADRLGMTLVLAGNLDIGNPDYFERCVATRLARRHEFIGEVDDVGKIRLLQDAQALLMPLDWPEPFGMVVIEAMACGTPVVAWPRGSMPELIEPGVNGFLVDTVDEAVHAVKMAKNLSRSNIRQHFVDHFSSARMAQRYLDVYDRALAQPDDVQPYSRHASG